MRAMAVQAPALATPQVMSQVTGFLYTVGGAGVTIAALIGPGHGLDHGLLVIGAVALATGLCVMRWGSLLPRGCYHVLVGAGTVLILLGTAIAPDAATALGISCMITFVALDTFFYFAWPGALAQLSFALVGCPLVLHGRFGVPASSWVVIDVVCIGIAAVVGAIVQRASTAVQDPVTGLTNRRGFDESAEALMRRSTRNGEWLAAALLDIDHFKEVNDTFGHGAGDQLLRSLGTQWRRCVPTEAVLARHGGDEFALLLPHHTPEAALRVVEQMRASVAGTAALSCGVTVHRPGESASQLMRRADTALYEAKSAGRGRSVLRTWHPSESVTGGAGRGAA